MGFVGSPFRGSPKVILRQLDPQKNIFYLSFVYFNLISTFALPKNIFRKDSPILHLGNIGDNCSYFTGYSAVRLAHLLWEQGVAGSNPATPTKQKSLVQSTGLFPFYPDQVLLKTGKWEKPGMSKANQAFFVLDSPKTRFMSEHSERIILLPPLKRIT